MLEALLAVFAVVALIVTEALGFLARRFGFITISEAARKSRPLYVAVGALFAVGFLWWLVHGAPPGVSILGLR